MTRFRKISTYHQIKDTSAYQGHVPAPYVPLADNNEEFHYQTTSFRQNFIRSNKSRGHLPTSSIDSTTSSNTIGSLGSRNRLRQLFSHSRNVSNSSMSSDSHFPPSEYENFYARSAPRHQFEPTLDVIFREYWEDRPRFHWYPDLRMWTDMKEKVSEWPEGLEQYLREVIAKRERYDQRLAKENELRERFRINREKERMLEEAQTKRREMERRAAEKRAKEERERIKKRQERKAKEEKRFLATSPYNISLVQHQEQIHNPYSVSLQEQQAQIDPYRHAFPSNSSSTTARGYETVPSSLSTRRRSRSFNGIAPVFNTSYYVHQGLAYDAYGTRDRTSSSYRLY